jgi:hypothetical protein
LWKFSISDILTLIVFHGQLSQFLNGFVIFHTPPHVGGVWKITKPFKKWLSWPWKTIKVTCIFFRILGSKFWKLLKLPKIILGAQKTLKAFKNYPYFISPIEDTTEKHVFLPQKGPYLPNRPNQKRAWDSVTRRVWVYREKFNIDFLFQKFFLTSQHILGLPKKIWAKNPMLNFSGWPRKLGSPFNWDSQKWSKMRHIVKFRPRGTPYGKSGHLTP